MDRDMAETEGSPDVKKGRNRLAATVVAGHAVKHLYNSGLRAIIMPEIKIGLGLTKFQFGALTSAQMATSWLSTMGGGYLGDRFSNRASLFMGISLGLMGVSLMLAGFAPNYAVMFAAMLLVGIGPSLYHPPAIGELSRRFPDRRGFAISLHGTGGITGEVIGPLVVAGLLTFLMWRDVLKLSVFPALLAAIMIWAALRSLPRIESQASSRSDYFASIAGLFGNRMLVVLVIVVMLRSVGDSAVDGFLPVYLREDLAYSAWRVALYLSLAQAMGLAAQPAMGYLSDRFGRKVVLLPGLAAMTVLSLLLALVEPGVSLFVVILARGVFKFSLHHIFIAAAIDAAGGQVQSTIVSLIYGAGFLGTVSPAVAGLISERFGIHSAFIYGASVGAVATIVLLNLNLARRDTLADAASSG